MANYPIIVTVVLGFIVKLLIFLAMLDGDYNPQNDWVLHVIPFVQIEEDGGFTVH